jgi:hypothetical protein
MIRVELFRKIPDRPGHRRGGDFTVRPDPARPPAFTVAVHGEATVDPAADRVYLGPVGNPTWTLTPAGLYLAAKGQMFGCSLLDESGRPDPAPRASIDELAALAHHVGPLVDHNAEMDRIANEITDPVMRAYAKTGIAALRADAPDAIEAAVDAIPDPAVRDSKRAAVARVRAEVAGLQTGAGPAAVCNVCNHSRPMNVHPCPTCACPEFRIEGEAPPPKKPRRRSTRSVVRAAIAAIQETTPDGGPIA